jgi:mono/diheme cytochrome c family protein
LLIVVIMLTQCAMRKSEPVKQKQFVPANNRIANGERVYMTYCQKCHPAGEAGLGPSINANPAPQFVKRFQMRHGLGVMPGFNKDEISRSDLHDISKYLKAWKSY